MLHGGPGMVSFMVMSLPAAVASVISSHYLVISYFVVHTACFSGVKLNKDASTGQHEVQRDT